MASSIHGHHQNRSKADKPCQKTCRKACLKSSLCDKRHVMVAAIDFGTTYSGYAYSFTQDPKNIIANKNWGDEIGATSYKCPTTVLIDSKGHFVAFGYKAEHQYSRISQSSSDDTNYELLRNFKLMLYNEKNLNLSTKIKSTKGKEFPAINVFAMALKYLKDHLVETLSKQVDCKPDDSKIKWVLTIPSIWSDKAKQFMREAAHMAGMIDYKQSSQLLLALEPEAASILCRNLDVKQFDCSSKEVAFPAGTKYMIIDAGGGTIDITAHEVLADGNLEEIMCANGGAFGGSQVDSNFEKLLKQVLGENFIEEYKAQCSTEWLELITDFQRKKKATNLGEDRAISIPLTWSIAAKYKELAESDIEHTLKNTGVSGVVFSGGSLLLSREVVIDLFMPVIQPIIHMVRKELTNENLAFLDYILLVGGFGESRILAGKLQEAFSEYARLIVPSSAELATVKGAVLFGHNPQVITARIARRTYGQSLSVDFKHGIHNPVKKFLDDDGRPLCRDTFRAFVHKNDKVKIGEAKNFYTIPTFHSQASVDITLYATDKEKVMYVDDEEVEKIGRLTLNMPLVPELSKYDRYIETNIYFGHTEIDVEAADVCWQEGDTVKTTISLGN